MNSIIDVALKGDELHKKLGGGLPKSSLLLIEGKNGMGKSVLSQRFAYGASYNGASVSYISTELTVPAFMTQMGSLNYHIEEAFLEEKFKFISLFPSTGTVNFQDDLIQRLVHAEKLFNSDVVIFDSLGDFIVKEGMELKHAYELMSFFNRISSQGKVVIFTVDPENIDETLLKALKNIANVYLSMEELEQYGNVMSILKVIRYSGAQDDVEKSLPFKVRAGIGIVLELAS